MGTMAWRGKGRCGRPRIERPAVDSGTPELQARRRLLAAGADPALTEYPLGLLLARNLITAEQHEAACYYGFLYGQTIGGARGGCGRFYQQLAVAAFDVKDLSEDQRAQIEALFRVGKGVLYH